MLVAVAMFFAGQANERVLNRTQTATETTLSPLMTYLTMPIRGFENVVMDLRDRSRAHEENKRLKKELARLSDIEAHSNAMAIKLSRFETILNVDASSGIPERKIAARAVSETNGPFVRSTLINAGAKKGIAKGYAVMTVDGLLGHVVRVGGNSARVLRLEDLNSRVSVMSLRSQSRAILTGDNSQNPVLSFITEGSDWAKGDVVITAGDDGMLPQGLPIGYVNPDKDGDLRVSLYVNDNHVDWVWVYPYDPLTPPESDPIIEPLPIVDANEELPASTSATETTAPAAGPQTVEPEDAP